LQLHETPPVFQKIEIETETESEGINGTGMEMTVASETEETVEEERG